MLYHYTKKDENDSAWKYSQLDTNAESRQKKMKKMKKTTTIKMNSVCGQTKFLPITKSKKENWKHLTIRTELVMHFSHAMYGRRSWCEYIYVCVWDNAICFLRVNQFQNNCTTNQILWALANKVNEAKFHSNHVRLYSLITIKQMVTDATRMMHTT